MYRAQLDELCLFVYPKLSESITSRDKEAEAVLFFSGCSGSASGWAMALHSALRVLAAAFAGALADWEVAHLAAHVAAKRNHFKSVC